MTLKNKKKYLLIFTFIVIADQVTKYIIKATLPLYDKIDVIKGFFRITHVQNSGAVWGILSDHPNQWVSLVITGLSIVALIVVFYYFFKLEAGCTFELTSLSFIVGGALGNIIDRVARGYVVDFIDMYIKSHHWPTYNIADSFITVGVVILIISVWRGKCTQF
ncbi:MAG: signal peptidase II [Candidatus Aminicenantes bacterium]|nr:signal peptidase II [Candidatus Aminicenantes bacterium]